MFEDVELRRRKRNQIYFSQDSASLQPLSLALESANRREVVLWAFECVAEPLRCLRIKHPHLEQPQTALEVVRAWARGDVRMPVARRAILACHAAARELADRESACLCHGVGQALSCVHTPRHALGLPVYELTAIVCREGDNYPGPVMKRIEAYLKMLDWVRGTDGDYTWIDFLQSAKKG